jgi:hypothetical protein
MRTFLTKTVSERFLACFLLMLSFSAVTLATAQAPDRLIYNGETYDLFSNPLESRYEKENRPSFWIAPNTRSSGNWRGYVATWEILNDQLYLVKINSWLCRNSAENKSDCRQANLKSCLANRYLTTGFQRPGFPVRCAFPTENSFNTFMPGTRPFMNAT